MDKIAIIDMGTNTFHLLLAELHGGRYRITLRDHRPVKIGKGGINQGFIPGIALERAVETMSTFKSVIDTQGADAIYAFGTSAIRNASNSADLLHKIKLRTGIDVRTISGDEEAELIFHGIQAAMDLGERASLIMDIGAGSVEFIIGNNTDIFWKQSFEIGGQRLLERFMKHDPIAIDEIDGLDQHFATELQPLLAQLGRLRPGVLVGSSGSFDTLSEMFCIRNRLPYLRESPETPLSPGGFYDIYADLIAKNHEERVCTPGMIDMRADMIVVASCLIRFILQRHCFETIRVSTYSLKEGALARELKRQKELTGHR